MSGPSVSLPPDASPEPTGSLLRRRTVLVAGLAVTGGLVLGASTCSAPAGQDDGSDFLDVSNPEARPGLKLLRMKLDNTESRSTPVPQKLVLGTSRDEDVDLVVTSTVKRVGIGVSQEEAGQSQAASVTVNVSRDKKVVVWVSPREIGPPLKAADRIEVRRAGALPTSSHLAAVEVWIEPIGGQWKYLAGSDGEPLDLGIVAVHAAVMRKRREDGSIGAEVVMYSPPRLRNNEGKLVVNESAKERWYWPVGELNGANLKMLAEDISKKLSDAGDKMSVLDGTQKLPDGTERGWAGTESSVLDLHPPNPEMPWALNPPTPVDKGLEINLFCSGQAHQPDGQLLTVGGHLHVEYDKNRTETDQSKHHNDLNGKALHTYGGEQKWQRLSDRPMPGEPGKDRRWYPTVTALPDGWMLITTGANDCFFDQRFWNTVNENYVLYNPRPDAGEKFIGPVGLATPELPNGGDKPIGWGDIGGEKENDPTKTPKQYPWQGCAIDDKKYHRGCTDETSKIIRSKLSTYPGVFVLPRANDGAVIAMVESSRAWLYDYVPTNKAGPLQLLPPSQPGPYYPMKTKGTRTYPWYGSIVLLPLKPGDPNSKVRILAAGGQNEEDTSRLTYRFEDAARGNTRERPPPSTKTAEVFEFDPVKPEQSSWQKHYKSMNNGRILCDATLLADGMVLVSGGSEEGWTNENPPSDPNEEFKFKLRPPVYDAELFDPEEQVFKKAARAQTARRYHAVALLLPDGTVLKAGSTGGFDADFDKSRPLKEIKHRWFLSRTDAERYFPPYLFRGPRPKIERENSGAVRALRYGKEFTVVASGPSMANSAKVALIRLGATTHGIDMDQRYVWLTISKQQADGNRRSITAVPPMNPAFAPPGDYFLVVVDNFGVPSEGEIVTVSG